MIRIRIPGAQQASIDLGDQEMVWSASSTARTLKESRVLEETIAVVVDSDYVVRAVVGIVGVMRTLYHDKSRRIIGTVLSDHPLVGQVIDGNSGSKNSIAYLDDAGYGLNLSSPWWPQWESAISGEGTR